MDTKKFITLKDLEVYQLSKKLSSIAWQIYSELNDEQKKIIGDQFIRSSDSVGANIAEGYTRYHYLEKVRFLYYSRGFLSEALNHWSELMLERKIITEETYNSLLEIHKPLEIKLNNFISSTLKSKRQ